MKPPSERTVSVLYGEPVRVRFVRTKWVVTMARIDGTAGRVTLATGSTKDEALRNAEQRGSDA